MIHHNHWDDEGSAQCLARSPGQSRGRPAQCIAVCRQVRGSAQRLVCRPLRRALYAVLLSPEVAHTAKAPMFLSLLFKVLKRLRNTTKLHVQPVQIVMVGPFVWNCMSSLRCWGEPHRRRYEQT